MADVEPAVEAGLRAQRLLLEAELAAGERMAGWKVGFGSPSGLALLDIHGPVIGHLLVSGEVPGGASVPIDGWHRPVVEAEIAVWIGADVPPGTSAEQAGDFVRAVGPAIELADIDHPPEDVERILAGNIYHRRYQLGAPDDAMSLADAAGLHAVVEHAGERLEVADPTGLVGDLGTVLARTARLAPLLGRGLEAGDVVLMGSIITPRPVTVGESCRYQLGAFPELRVAFGPEPSRR